MTKTTITKEQFAEILKESENEKSLALENRIISDVVFPSWLLQVTLRGCRLYNVTFQPTGPDTMVISAAYTYFDDCNLAYCTMGGIFENCTFRSCTGDRAHITAKFVGTEFVSSSFPMATFDLQVAHIRATDTTFISSNWIGALSGRFLRCTFSRATLSHSSMINVTFSHCTFVGAKLATMSLTKKGIDFEYCDFTNVNFTHSELGWDIFTQCTGLDTVNTSGSTGFGIAPHKWMAKNFNIVTSKMSWVVWKVISEKSPFINEWPWPPPEPGLVLYETVNRFPTAHCGCGVNFATLPYVFSSYAVRRQDDEKEISSITGGYEVDGLWMCYIRLEDGPSIVVPFLSEKPNMMKARCARLELVKPVSYEWAMKYHQRWVRGDEKWS